METQTRTKSTVKQHWIYILLAGTHKCLCFSISAGCKKQVFLTSCLINFKDVDDIVLIACFCCPQLSRWRKNPCWFNQHLSDSLTTVTSRTEWARKTPRHLWPYMVCIALMEFPPPSESCLILNTHLTLFFPPAFKLQRTLPAIWWVCIFHILSVTNCNLNVWFPPECSWVVMAITHSHVQ